MARRTRPVKWGHVSSIDYSTQVGTPAWYAAHPSHKIRKLSAYRFLHKVAQGEHSLVRAHARSLGRNPSSTMTTQQMVRAVRFGPYAR